MQDDAWVYSVDGKWLRRSGVILIHRDVTHHEVLWWSYARSESYQAIGNDLNHLTILCGDAVPTGAVSDWKGSIVGSVKRFFGDIPHQRCLAHVDRDIKRLLPKHSPIQGTQELRKIGRAVIHIKTDEEKQDWLTWLHCWEAFYGDLLQEKTFREEPETEKRRWWYTHSNLRAAYRLLTKDQDNLFTHLEHHHIPTTNNGLEGLNSNVKGKLADHRGMKYPQQAAFIFWLLTFQKVHTAADLKNLWDYWKHSIYH